MPQFLNSEIAAEDEKNTELISALGRIAELELRILAMTDVICEMAIENAKLRVNEKMKAEDRKSG